jgi:hypothetical protein
VSGGLCLIGSRNAVFDKTLQPKHTCQHRSGQRALIIVEPDRVLWSRWRNIELEHAFKAVPGLAQLALILELSPNFGDGLKDQAAAWA